MKKQGKRKIETRKKHQLQKFKNKLERTGLELNSATVVERNRTAVLSAYVDLLSSGAGMPTRKQISDYTGLSQPTVISHEQEILKDAATLNKQLDLYKSQFIKLLLDESINKKNMKAAKLLSDIYKLTSSVDVHVNQTQTTTYVLESERVEPEVINPDENR